VLQKITFIDKFVTGLSMNSTYTYKNTYRFANADSTNVKRHDFSPLVALSGTIRKWPIKFNYQHTMSKEKKDAGGTANTTTFDSGDEIDVSYEIENNGGLTEIKIFKWNIPVKGRTTTGLKISRSSGYDEYSEQPRLTESSISFAPYLSYIFTDNVTGKVQYSYSDVKTNKGDETRTNDFGLVINIQF
jgi:hypothetical protein